jgi:hypothetical protein
MIEDKTSIRKLSENIKFISTRFETGQKGLPFYPFLKFVQFFYILAANVNILSIIYNIIYIYKQDISLSGTVP